MAEGGGGGEDPDWLSAFQAPDRDVVTLSSGSDSPPESSPPRSAPSSKEEKDIDNAEDGTKIKGKKPKSAQNEVHPAPSEDALDEQEEGPADEDSRDKPTGHSVSKRLPLIFPEKVQRSKALIECDGDSIELSGDVGAVGRIVISNGPAGNEELLLDLKGTIYKTTIVPSRTFCIVSVGQSEAKIEAIMNDFIQLEPQSNLFQAETMVEGTLDGFSFDSEEEGDKNPGPSGHQNDENNEDEDKPKTKAKRKPEKTAGTGKKKTKVAERAPKKRARKTPAALKSKKKK